MPRSDKEITSIDIVASVSTLPAAHAALNGTASEAHLAAHELLEAEPERDIVPVLPRICRDSEIEQYLGVAYRFGSAVASTLGQVTTCVQRDIPVQTHWSLNVTNAATVEMLGSMGATRIWLSPELSGRQITDIAHGTKFPVGTAVAGLQEVMVTEHCILMAQGECNQKCEDCLRRKDHFALRDKKGYCFPVKTDATGRSHVFNSVPLDLTEALEEIAFSGVRAVRLDLETALHSFIGKEIARCRNDLIDVYAGREGAKARENTTRGHFYRGVV